MLRFPECYHAAVFVFGVRLAFSNTLNLHCQHVAFMDMFMLCLLHSHMHTGKTNIWKMMTRFKKTPVVALSRHIGGMFGANS